MVSKKKFIFQKIFCCDIEDNIIYTIYTKLCSIYKDIFHYFFFTVTCAAHLCIYMCT
jgi:hypothetical protein